MGFEDCPPLDVVERNEDAGQFFLVSHERNVFQDKVHKIHEREDKAWMAKHAPQEFVPGQKLWVRQLPGSSRLFRLWFGPCEVISVLSASGIMHGGRQGSSWVANPAIHPIEALSTFVWR